MLARIGDVALIASYLIAAFFVLLAFGDTKNMPVALAAAALF